jgi:predicted dehydrogenase
MRAAVIGAGSVGNHLAYSARKLDWQITVFDRDQEALDRFQREIFPSRYGFFDTGITLSLVENLFSDKYSSFDVILIGTPPDTHLEILRAAVELKPHAIFIEKPFCPPTESDIFESKKIIENNPFIKFFCGYNHRLSIVTKNLLESLHSVRSKVINLEVDWLESWDGILRAHPWINGPGETYLGSLARGGGALFEHSHGLDLWWQIANNLGLGLPIEVKAEMKRISDSNVGTDYDERVHIEISTESGFVGKVHQDVLKSPSQKKIYVSTDRHEFIAEYGRDNRDKLSCIPLNGDIGGFSLELMKPRPTDFDPELELIDNMLSKRSRRAPLLNIDALSGLYTAYIAKKVVDSSDTGKSVRLESKGWESLKNA